MLRLADLIAFIGADTSGLDSSLANAETKSRSWVSNLGGTVTSLLGGVVVAGATAAVGAVVGIGAAAFNVAADLDEATGDMIARLNVTEEEAERLADVIKSTYGDNFADSIQDAGAAVETVYRAMGDQARQMSNEDLTLMTERALALRDAFGIDVAGSMRTVSILMRNGVARNGEEAFDIIAAGMQNGLNVSDDLLDTLNEYSDDFARLGFTGEQTLGLLNRGLEAGAFNTDKLADAVNEFGINLRDPAIRENIAAVDAGVLAIYDQFQQGAITEAQALEGMLQRLSAIQDPIAQDTAGVLLFRSMWEDLGSTAILAMQGIEEGTVNVGGAGERLNEQYNTIGERFAAVWRRVQVALEPLGEAILGIAEQAMPYIEQAAQDLADHMPEIVDWIVNALGNVRTFIETTLVPAFQVGLFWLTNVAWPAISTVIQWGIEAFNTLRTFVVETLAPAAEQAFNNIRNGIQTAWNWFDTNIMPAIRTVFSIVSDVFNAFRSAFQGDWSGFGEFLRNAWDTIWNGISTTVSNIGQTILNVIQSIIDGFLHTDWLGVGRSIIEGIANGIGNFAGGLVQAAENAANSALDAIKGFLGIASPSRVMAIQVGKPMAEGIALGIGDATGVINRALLGAIQIPDVGGLQAAGASVAAGAQTTVYGGLHVTFQGNAPTSEGEAEDSARLLLNALAKKGLALA